MLPPAPGSQHSDTNGAVAPAAAESKMIHMGLSVPSVLNFHQPCTMTVRPLLGLMIPDPPRK